MIPPHALLAIQDGLASRDLIGPYDLVLPPTPPPSAEQPAGPVVRPKPKPPPPQRRETGWVVLAEEPTPEEDK